MTDPTPFASAESTRQRQIEATVEVELLGGNGPTGMGALLDAGLVLTSITLVGEVPFVAVAAASGRSEQAESLAEVGMADGARLTVLRLLRPLPGAVPAVRFGQVRAGDVVDVVTREERSWKIVRGVVTADRPNNGMLILDVDRLAMAGSPVFVDDALVAVVASTSANRAEVVTLTDIAGGLARWAPQVRDSLWPVNTDQQIQHPLADPTAVTPAANALVRWFDTALALNEERSTPPAALWAAFVLLAGATPRQNVATLVTDHLLPAYVDQPASERPGRILSAFGIDEQPQSPSSLPHEARIVLLAPVEAAAVHFRDMTEPAEPIHLRHVLAATLDLWPDPLVSAGGDVAALRDALIAMSQTIATPSVAEAWKTLLSPSGAAVIRGRRLAGIDPDVVDRNTHLGDELRVRDDVITLCDVLAARGVDPPVSVGLFGQWGTGKSYFMALMRQRMDELQAAAIRARDAGSQPAYCTDIQQITFNAWHYMDANLWASLAVRLFEGMAALEGTAIPSDRADELRAELQRREQQLTTVDRRLRSALTDPRLDDAANDLGIEATRAEVVSLVTELTRLSGFLRAISRTLFVPRRWTVARRVAAASSAAVVVGLLATGILLARRNDAQDALVAWISAAGTVLFAVARVASGLRRALSKVNIVLAASSLKPSDVTTERMERDNEMVALKAELDEVEKGRALSDYVLDRAGSEDYRRHFGLISVVRRDLETLALRLRAAAPDRRIVLYIDDLDRCPPARVVEVLQAVHLLLAFPLFVVVVGVDPRWLLRSLQRHYREILSTDHDMHVHERHDDMLTETTPHDYLEKIFQIPFSLSPMTGDGFGRLIAKLAAHEPADAPTGGHPASTARGSSEIAAPQRPIEADQGRRREAHRETGVGDNSPPARVERPSGRFSSVGQTARSPDIGEGYSSVHSSAPGGSEDRGRVAPIDPNPPRLNISDDEVIALSAVGPLIPTPRAAKRLVNLYRLIKAGMPDAEIDAFVLEIRYEPLVVLLGALVGYPRQARLLLLALAYRGEEDNGDNFLAIASGAPFWNFVHTLPSRPVLHDGLTERAGDQDDWTALLAALNRVLETLTRAAAQPVGDYRDWVPLVLRYSFDGALSTVGVSFPVAARKDGEAPQEQPESD